MGKKLAVPKKRDAARTEATKALRELSPVQRLAVEALLHTISRKAAFARLVENGVDIEMKTLDRWCNNAKFIRARRAREIQIAARISKDSVIVNAQNLMDEALTPKPILFKGEDTGFREIELGAALNANEQLAKATGAFVQERDGKTQIVIDIDFSGRKDPVRETVIGAEVIEGELIEADVIEPEPAAQLVEADDSWLQ